MSKDPRIEIIHNFLRKLGETTQYRPQLDEKGGWMGNPPININQSTIFRYNFRPAVGSGGFDLIHDIKGLLGRFNTMEEAWAAAQLFAVEEDSA